MLHALVQHFDRSAHGTDDSAPDDALRQFEMMETEQVHPFIEIEHSFGDVVKCKKLGMAAIKIVHRQVNRLQLMIECLAEARPDVQQGEKTRRIQPAAMTQPSADDVVIVEE